MVRWISGLALLPILLLTNQGRADPLEYIGKPVRGIPVSSAVKVGKSIFVSGMPAFDSSGKLAVGDFPAQMKQVMDNLTGILKAAGTDWSRIVKTNVLLMRASDFAEMNRIYGSYFPDGKYPARQFQRTPKPGRIWRVSTFTAFARQLCGCGILQERVALCPHRRQLVSPQLR